MSAPIIFIGIPILLGGVLWMFARRVTLTSVLASSFSLVLALLAGLLPISQPFMLGSVRVVIPAEMVILGRQLVLDQESLPAVILLYALGAFWFLGIRPARAPRRMAPLGMILLGLAVATLAVRPFLFSAIIFEGLVLVSVPLLVPAGRAPGRGVVRYIIFMTLAMPFILLSGALAGRLELNPSGSNLILYAVLLLGCGFAIWLAVFPLNTWVPMLAEDSPPFVTGFLLSIQSTSRLINVGEFHRRISLAEELSFISHSATHCRLGNRCISRDLGSLSNQSESSIGIFDRCRKWPGIDDAQSPFS